MDKRKIKSITGAAGTLMFFHGNMFHASANKLSPWDRISIFASYNSVASAPQGNANPRPLYIAERDCVALTAVPDNALLEMGVKVG